MKPNQTENRLNRKKRQRARRKCAVLLLLLFLFSIAAQNLVLQAAEPKLTVSKKTVYVGTDYQIQGKNIASNATVTYKSSDKTVATVSQKGVVTPKAKGTATITVTIKQGGKTYTRTIALTVKDPYITISNKQKTLVANSDYLLVGKAYGLTDVKFTFTSSDVLIAKVDKSTGMVHARSAGKVKITMKDTTSGLSVSYTITVVENTGDNLGDMYVSTKNFDTTYSYTAPENTEGLAEEELALINRLTDIQKRITAGQSITIDEMTVYYLHKNGQ